MNKSLKLLSLLLPISGIAAGVCLSTTACSDTVPTCPDDIVINGQSDSTVIKTLMSPYNADYDIKAPFTKNDMLDEKKYSNNLIK
jgi:hypothetical protein